MNNFILIVLDGVGVGELPDAAKYRDKGSNTLQNMANVLGGINLPTLQQLGLGNIIPIKGVEPEKNPLASFGKMAEKSKGKDSTTGHWEIGGIYVEKDFDYFPDGFTNDIMNRFLAVTKCKGYLGNIAASGTEIINELGDEHLKTGFPIIYTSADSVFQIAAHQEAIPLEKLYEICELTRDIVLAQPLNVGRVIARPFIGTSGKYERTVYRKDFSLNPPKATILDLLFNNKIQTLGIGKINDLFNYRGISVQQKTKSNREGIDYILKYTSEVKNSFIFANLVDFDVYFGHRNDPAGFANSLKEFDSLLPNLLNVLDESDRLLLTADHGNDPTTPSTDHSREYVPILYYGKNKIVKDLGIRKTFSDAGKTVADFFNISNNFNATSFYCD